MPQTNAVSLNGDSDHNASLKSVDQTSGHENGYHTPHRKVFDSKDFQHSTTEEVDENIVRLFF